MPPEQPKTLAAAVPSASEDSAVLPSAILHLVAVVPWQREFHVMKIAKERQLRCLFEVQWPMEVQMHEVTC